MAEQTDKQEKTASVSKIKRLFEDAFGKVKPDNKKALRRRGRARRALALLALGIVVIVAVLVLIISLLTGSGANDNVTEVLKTEITDTVTTEPESDTITAVIEEDTATVAPVESGYVPTGKYLSVITAGSSNEKYVVITIDNLADAAALNTILDAAEASNAKLTLFPMGKNVVDNTDVQSALRRAYYSLGCEIENHTYENGSLYSMTQEDMANEIYMCSMAVNKALGMNYEMHYLRPREGYGENDLRTHQYLEQLGTYKGIALWNVDGTKASKKTLAKSLAAGNIYLFDCTKDNAEMLAAFIPYIVEQGYQIVTLNTLLGNSENTVTPLENPDAMSAEVPTPVPFEYTNYVLLGGKEYNRLYAVQLLQKRLQELGYLDRDAKVDGCYGSDTKSAVKYFQYAAGLTVDGYAGVETQLLLFSDEAPAFGQS